MTLSILGILEICQRAMDGNTCSLLELGNSEKLEFAMDGGSVT